MVDIIGADVKAAMQKLKDKVVNANKFCGDVSNKLKLDMNIRLPEYERVTPKINYEAIVGKVQLLLTNIEENIDGCNVTDETLENWARELALAILESDEINKVLNGVVVSILKKESACNTRLRYGHEEIHNRIMLGRWHNLRIFVCRDFPSFHPDLENQSEDVLEYCEEIGLILPQRECQAKDTQQAGLEQEKARREEVKRAKELFRIKYNGAFKFPDMFIEKLETVTPKEFKSIYSKSVRRLEISLKDFFDDCISIVPERKGERGFNYNNIKNFR